MEDDAMGPEEKRLTLFPGLNETDVPEIEVMTMETLARLNLQTRYQSGEMLTMEIPRQSLPFVRDPKFQATMDAGCTTELNIPKVDGQESYLVKAGIDTTAKLNGAHTQRSSGQETLSNAVTSFGRYFRTPYQGKLFYETMYESQTETSDSGKTAGTPFMRESLGCAINGGKIEKRVIYDPLLANDSDAFMLQTMRSPLPAGTDMCKSDTLRIGTNDNEQKGFFKLQSFSEAVSASSLIEMEKSAFPSANSTLATNSPMRQTIMGYPKHTELQHNLYAGKMDNELSCLRLHTELPDDYVTNELIANYSNEAHCAGQRFLVAVREELLCTADPNISFPSLYFDPTLGTNLPFRDVTLTTVDQANIVEQDDDPRFNWKEYMRTQSNAYETRMKRENKDVDFGYEQNRFAFGSPDFLGLPSNFTDNKSGPSQNKDTSLDAYFSGYMRKVDTVKALESMLVFTNNTTSNTVKPVVTGPFFDVNNRKISPFIAPDVVMDTLGTCSLNFLKPKYEVPVCFDTRTYQGLATRIGTNMDGVQDDDAILESRNVANFTGVIKPSQVTGNTLNVQFSSPMTYADMKKDSLNKYFSSLIKSYNGKKTINMVKPSILWRGLYAAYLAPVTYENNGSGPLKPVVPNRSTLYPGGESAGKCLYLGHCMARTGTPLYDFENPPTGIEIRSRVASSYNDGDSFAGANYGSLYSIVRLGLSHKHIDASDIIHEKASRGKQSRLDYEDSRIEYSTQFNEHRIVALAPSFDTIYGAEMFDDVFHNMYRKFDTGGSGTVSYEATFTNSSSANFTIRIELQKWDTTSQISLILKDVNNPENPVHTDTVVLYMNGHHVFQSSSTDPKFTLASDAFGDTDGVVESVEVVYNETTQEVTLKILNNTALAAALQSIDGEIVAETLVFNPVSSVNTSIVRTANEYIESVSYDKMISSSEGLKYIISDCISFTHIDITDDVDSIVDKLHDHHITRLSGNDYLTGGEIYAGKLISSPYFHVHHHTGNTSMSAKMQDISLAVKEKANFHSQSNIILGTPGDTQILHYTYSFTVPEALKGTSAWVALTDDNKHVNLDVLYNSNKFK